MGFSRDLRRGDRNKEMTKFQEGLGTILFLTIVLMVSWMVIEAGNVSQFTLIEGLEVTGFFFTISVTGFFLVKFVAYADKKLQEPSKKKSWGN